MKEIREESNKTLNEINELLGDDSFQQVNQLYYQMMITANDVERFASPDYKKKTVLRINTND